MKKTSILALGAIVALLSACGSSKNASSDYYNNPSRKARVAPELKEEKREVREVDKLAAKETDKMRAVGIGNDVDEKYARREAIRDGQATLAGYLETAIVALTTEYHKKAGTNAKKFSEANIEEMVEMAVAQKVTSRMIGVPEVYDVSDGTVSVYVCVELSTPTEKVLEEVYDGLSRDGVIGTDYDKQKFIQDNNARINELREKVK